MESASEDTEEDGSGTQALGLSLTCLSGTVLSASRMSSYAAIMLPFYRQEN